MIKAAVELVNDVIITRIIIYVYFLAMIMSDFELAHVTSVLDEPSASLSIFVLEPQDLLKE